MIVDDNPQIRDVIRGILKFTGAEFHECSSGEEAVAACNVWKPHWILMDIKMKELDGLSATRLIKHSLPEANVIIVTNYSDSDLREEAMKAGADGFVLKEHLTELRTLLNTHTHNNT